MKIKLLYFCISVFSIFQLSAQVGINTTSPKAQLDIESSSQGVLVPRIALESKYTADPVTAPDGGLPENSTLIYNTATIADELSPGFYYWNTDRWVPIGGESKDWTATGNLGTNPSENFLGTKDDAPISFRTNNIERLRISTQNQILAMENGTASAPFYSWQDDTNTGLWKPSANQLSLGANALENLRLDNSSNPRTIFNNNQENIDFEVRTSGSTNTLFVDGQTDNLGIGTASPQAKLHVNGNLRIDDIPEDLASRKVLVIGADQNIAQNLMPSFYGISGLTIPVCQDIEEGTTGSFNTTVNGQDYTISWEVLKKETGTSVAASLGLEPGETYGNNQSQFDAEVHPLKAQNIQVKYDFEPALPFTPDGFNLTAYNNSNYPDTFSLNYTDNSAESLTVNITRTDLNSSDENDNCWAGQFYFDIMMYRY